MKKWKKEFNDKFDDEFKEELEEWKKEMEGWKKEHAKFKDEFKKERSEQLKEIEKAREEQHKELAKVREERRRIAEEVREVARVAKKAAKAAKAEGGNVFYLSTDGKDKNLKVKKTIKIKMPKDAKLKMNVRHGEVKLAQHLRNIKATLSHTRLLADVVDGEFTEIEASYSPVDVENWNYGQLKVNYGKDVSLRNVNSLKLTSNSSDVFIGSISNYAIINGSFGELEIAKILESFSSLDIGLENTDAVLVLPKTAFNIYCNSLSSEVVYPKAPTVKVSESYSNELIKGYYKQKNTDKSININAKYSEIVMQ